MKRFWTAAAVAGAMVGLAACEPTPPTPPTGGPAVAPKSPPPPAARPSAGPGTPARDAAATDGPPAFASVYPGGEVDGPPVLATGPDGPGGLVTYLTDAKPETVIAFHRANAEAAGLSSVMAMNQGDARAYGAADDKANLQVVAAPMPDGRTSVQLSWSAAG